LEHVANFREGLKECYRVLKPGGSLLLSVPFRGISETIVRAKVLPNGGIDHLLEPEYHPDPNPHPLGCLCFQNFGWDLLDVMRELGFRDAAAVAVHGTDFGYFNIDCQLFGRKV
jgi:DNA modification methylase